MVGYDTTLKELPPKSITHDMMKMSLNCLMFLKRKRFWKIKARGCAGGRSQRKYVTKLESSSSCVKTHALFLSCLVDAFERRKVVITDIPGAFLSADWSADAPDCWIWFEGAMVKMICQIKPEYRKLIRETTKRNGGIRRMLVVKLPRRSMELC